ncbi:DUF2750 domain-containing protein [Leeuwenhoekiella blandensis]|uniref:DUF2750 domain-containing protein n=1 Tax=Leeuwenhoekiella blandensis (strain CECT 7118 / CCUG 51940 / KCTC 22103 / MED217) TaxID=398720 RepID=A3XHE6_LEEBM|nr:DUF2750 domain-containing protein [Leeuwenhoekiella blandensis]EAQ51298.1 hypothetical protein MED217_17185 [Leeuwenhoekiella blandensis MED217]
MSNKKVENILNLKASDRYAYLVRKVADFEQLFLISDKNGNYVTCGTEETKCIPVWPELDFAREFLNSDWRDFNVVMIELNIFLDWLDRLEMEGYFIGGFPNREFNAIVVKPNEMKSHLIFECSQYE